MSYRNNFMKSGKKKQPHTPLFIVLAVIAVGIFAGTLLMRQKSVVSNSMQSIMPKLSPIQAYTRLSQADEDTSNWKIYTDAILKFSIKYPANVMIDPEENTPG